MKKDEILNEQDDARDFMVDSILSGLDQDRKNQLLRMLLDQQSPQQLEKIAMEYDLI